MLKLGHKFVHYLFQNLKIEFNEKPSILARRSLDYHFIRTLRQIKLFWSTVTGKLFDARFYLSSETETMQILILIKL